MGTNAIGAMVVAGPEGFVKNQYRTFNIKSADLTPGDDYAMMREVLTRRFARLVRQGETAEAGAFPDTPDLVIIDGGRGQFEAAREVLGALGVEGVRLAAIAKGPDRNAGRETFFVEGRESFKLPPRDPALFFVQRLRDEAHRFAIGTHRARRKKEFVRSPLDEIPGIGPARKRALLHAFGSAKAVARAGLADLEKTPGLNAATAKLVYDFFHEARPGAGGPPGSLPDAIRGVSRFNARMRASPTSPPEAPARPASLCGPARNQPSKSKAPSHAHSTSLIGPLTNCGGGAILVLFQSTFDDFIRCSAQKTSLFLQRDCGGVRRRKSMRPAHGDSISPRNRPAA
jgi:hypothetical protein